MATTFKPVNNVCELNFDDRYFYKLPLHEDTVDIIIQAGDRLKGLKLTDDKESIDAAYNAMLDIIDDVLGEGASDDIMSLYTNPGILEAKDVVMYIIEGFKSDYEKVVSLEAPEVMAKRKRR